MDTSNGLPALDRRALLRSALALLGGSMVGVPAELFANSLAKPARFFNDSQFAILDEAAEIILPRTDTPGAREAGVAAALDALTRDWASRERQQQFRALLDDIDRAAVAHEGKSFLALTPEQRAAVVAHYDAARAGRDPVYSRFKELVLILYYLSEAGATQELRYEHAPGKWEASVPMTPETRAWAVT